MSDVEIEEILDHKEEFCVSIILPTHRLMPDRFQDKLVFKKIVSEVKNLLIEKSKESQKDISNVIANLEKQYEQIDFNHSLDGLGIFVSSTISKSIRFPFSVVEKISISDKFYVRDLLYYNQTMFDYYVLSLQENEVRLFEGLGSKLKEVHNTDFPLEYKIEYEYSDASRITSNGSTVFKQFEKDKTEIQEIRMKDFFKKADKKLVNYEYFGRPILLAGDKRLITDYLQLTKNLNNVIGKIQGNFNVDILQDFSVKAWGEVQRSFRTAHNNLLSTLPDLVGSEMIAVGISDVWRTAEEGKGLELIVEKDLIKQAYFSSDKYLMKLRHQSNDESYKRINDLVEMIIQTVLSKNGRVVFVENGSMGNFDGIALKLRYPDLG